MCDVKGCRYKEVEVIFLGANLCPVHWIKHCNGEELNLKKGGKITAGSIRTE